MGTWGRSSLFCMHAIETGRTQRGAGASGNRLIDLGALDLAAEGSDVKIERRHESRTSARPREDRLSIAPPSPSATESEFSSRG
jgi:hypothetical protein